MTYTNACAAMCVDRKKVKLPEWIGYWWIPTVVGMASIEKSIRVLTKNGDILDTPWVDKYRHRNDWEITDGQLGFEFAILALKNGKRVTCGALGGNWLQLSQLSVGGRAVEKEVWVKELLRCAPESFMPDNKINSVVWQLWPMSSKWLLYNDYSLCDLNFIEGDLVYTPVNEELHHVIIKQQ
jgi:hypothetical protein